MNIGESLTASKNDFSDGSFRNSSGSSLETNSTPDCETDPTLDPVKLPKSNLLPIPKKSRTIKTDKPRPFLCSVCTRGFARQEHLKRHQRSHTNEKPFLCAFCGRCFARRDLVLRHQQKLHAALMGQDKALREAANTKELKQQLNERHIITKPGNKETILPTPCNPTGQALLLKRKSKDVQKNTSVQRPSSIYTPKKRQRCASFSASSMASYVQLKDASNIMAKEEMNDTPHQVGFSTPQLTAQQLQERVKMADYNINLTALDIPVDISLSEPMVGLSTNWIESNFEMCTSLFSEQNGNQLHDECSQKNQQGYLLQAQQNLQQYHKDLSTPSLFTPLISDFLQIGSSGGGVNGYVDLHSIDSNIDCFSYKGINTTHFNNSPEFNNSNNSIININDNPNVLLDNNDTKKKKELLHIEQGMTLNSSENLENFLYELQTATTDGDNLIQKVSDVPQSLPINDDHWLSEFINTQMDNNFKVDMNNFNEIGFPCSTSPTVTYTPSSLEYGNIPLKSNQTINTNNVSSFSLFHNEEITSIQNFNPNNTNTSTIISESPPLDIQTLFKSRQVDLFKKAMENVQLSNFLPDNCDKIQELSSQKQTHMTDYIYKHKYSRLKYFSKELHSQILKENNLTSVQFPTLEELNTYVNLYQDEFHIYFPFIHLHSVEPTFDIYPLLLSISVIGALHGFHSSHAMLLFNISKFHIREYLERTKDCHDKTPLWVIQSMVLLIFIGIFNNDLSITRTISTKIMSLIELIELKKLNQPLENFVTPPIKSDQLMNLQHSPELNSGFQQQYFTKEQKEEIFKYFITAQSRIRACHTILLISNLFTSLVDLDCCFRSIYLKCGVPCYHEDLYFCETYEDWMMLLDKYNIILDSKFSLIQLSNGEETYKNCLIYLANGHQFFYDHKKVSFKSLLSLLISIHEKIFIERHHLKNEKGVQLNEMKWCVRSRPIIESLLKNWEVLYIKNGGILTPNDSNLEFINSNPSLRLIIPLLLFAKIRTCLSLTSIMRNIWLKDWAAMNKALEEEYCDWDSLREATDYALDTVKFWIDSVSIVKNAEKTSLRTPIFSIACIFSSILIIAEYLKRIEIWARRSLNNATNSDFKSVDRALWLKSEIVWKKVETHLLPRGYNMQSYAEFLRVRANGALDVEVLDDNLARIAVDPNTKIEQTIQVILKAKLSSRSLYLGVRILGDAPIWPIALLFAHALQSRAIYNLTNFHI